MKCQRLDSDGKRCNREAAYIEHFHGDPEIYSYGKTAWVEIYLCGHHKTVEPDSENYIGKIKEQAKNKTKTKNRG